MTVDPEKNKPEWWVENEELREFLDLPEYTPPRLADDVYTHEIVSELEERFDCELRFVGIDTRYPEDWELRIDGESAFTIGHRRDENGNTVYTMDAETFRRRVEAWFED